MGLLTDQCLADEKVIARALKKLIGQTPADVGRGLTYEQLRRLSNCRRARVFEEFSATWTALDTLPPHPILAHLSGDWEPS